MQPRLEAREYIALWSCLGVPACSGRSPPARSPSAARGVRRIGSPSSLHGMHEHLRPSGREVTTDQAVAHDLVRQDFCNYQFQRLVAINKKFTNCNFSFSEFDAAYLRKCIFDSCNFTGCKFTNANLRGSKFIGCTFGYAEFSNTYVEAEILDTGCPGQENKQQAFARTLQINYHQIGDAVAENNAIKIELEATRIHLHKAWRSRESYYRRRYNGFQRAKMFINWSVFVMLDFFCGNGESAAKLLRSLILLVLLILIGDIYIGLRACLKSLA